MRSVWFRPAETVSVIPLEADPAWWTAICVCNSERWPQIWQTLIWFKLLHTKLNLGRQRQLTVVVRLYEQISKIVTVHCLKWSMESDHQISAPRGENSLPLTVLREQRQGEGNAVCSNWVEFFYFFWKTCSVTVFTVSSVTLQRCPLSLYQINKSGQPLNWEVGKLPAAVTDRTELQSAKTCPEINANQIWT